MSQTLVSDEALKVVYTLSLIIVIIVCNLLIKGNPKMNTMVIVIIGVVVGYICMKILKIFLPVINNVTTNLYLYFTFEVMNNFNSTGYYHVWPPILAVLIIFIILLYNGQLGG
jgi:ABC-type Fe3+-siderophore transport system permease subunit